MHALETVIEAMDVGIALVGPDDRLTLANSALSRIATGPLATRQDLEAAIGGQLRDGQFESSGPNRWIAIRTYDVGDPDGPSTLVIARDVTERRRAEASQDAFIGVLSHELRTPITTIVGLAEIMARPGFDPVARDGAGLLLDLAAEATRLGQLIEDLLVLSRAQGGQMTIDVEPVLVDRIVHDAVAAESARYPRVRFDIDVPARLPPVDGDMTYLGQVLRNMIGNAAKYGPPEGPVVIRALGTDRSVTVVVLDEGPGFDPADGPRLFEIFFRSARTARSQSGSGIGLYVARTLVEAMGGTIWARLRDEGGAEFGFSLPVVDAGDLDSDESPGPRPEGSPGHAGAG